MGNIVNPINCKREGDLAESSILSRSIFFIIIGIAFYLLDRFCIFNIDDYMYAYKFGTFEPITSFSDIISSQCDHYFQQNGRFIIHCFVQLFCGIIGIEWFRIFNTIAFIAFCGLTTRIVCQTWKAPIVWYALTTFIIWLCIPRICNTLLGNIAFGINYLWAGIFSILFLLLFQHTAKHNQGSFIHKLILLIVGSICGSLQETFSIPIAGFLFIYYCFNIKKLRGNIFWLLLGYCIGAAILIFAPGNFVRLSTNSSSFSFLDIVINRIRNIAYDGWVLWLVVLGLIIGYIKSKTRLIEFVHYNIPYYVMICIGLLFAIFIAYIGEHQLFFIGWLAIVVILNGIYFSFKRQIERYSTHVVLCILFIMIPLYSLIYKYRKEVYELRQDLITEISNSKDGLVAAGDYLAYEVEKNVIGRKYTLKMGYEPEKHRTSLYHTGDQNHFKTYIPCRIEELPKLLIDTNLVSDNIWYSSQYYCYIIKVPSNIPDNQVVIQAEYPLYGLSKIKRKIFNEPLSVSSNFLKSQIDDIATIGDYDYIFFYEALNGHPISMKFLTADVK